MHTLFSILLILLFPFMLYQTWRDLAVMWPITTISELFWFILYLGLMGYVFSCVIGGVVKTLFGS
jgi:hypothetical protein